MTRHADIRSVEVFPRATLITATLLFGVLAVACGSDGHRGDRRKCEHVPSSAGYQRVSAHMDLDGSNTIVLDPALPLRRHSAPWTTQTAARGPDAVLPICRSCTRVLRRSQIE